MGVPPFAGVAGVANGDGAPEGFGGLIDEQVHVGVAVAEVQAAEPRLRRVNDDIRRLEEVGVTDLQVTPWSVPGILAEMGVGASMRQQPPLAVKLEAIRRYADRIISRFT